MMRQVWSVLCHRSSTDKDSNNISLFEVTEQLSFSISGPDVAKAKAAARDGKLMAPANLELVTLLERTSNDGVLDATIKAVIVDPTGKQLHQLSHDLVFPEGKRRLRVTGKMEGIPVTKSGVYRILVTAKGVREREWGTATDLPLEISVDFS